MPIPDRYPHDFRNCAALDYRYRCERCGYVDPDDGTESECPALLRAAVDRLTAELAVARANPSIRSNGCEPTE